MRRLFRLVVALALAATACVAAILLSCDKQDTSTLPSPPVVEPTKQIKSAAFTTLFALSRE